MTKQLQDAYIVAAVRTPIGKAPRGMFRNVRPDDLLAHVLKSALDQCKGIDPHAIDDVIVGCAMPEAEQGMNVARVALLLAGLPNSVSGMTINRFCSSGVQAVALAADRIRLGEADVMIAAGTESMSMIPMGGNKPSFTPAIFSRDENIAIGYGMGITAEKVAQQWNVSREQQDAFNRSMVGRVLPVLFERRGRHDGQVGGRSPYLQAVHLEAPASWIGAVHEVRSVAAGPNRPTQERMSKPSKPGVSEMAGTSGMTLERLRRAPATGFSLPAPSTARPVARSTSVMSATPAITSVTASGLLLYGTPMVSFTPPTLNRWLKVTRPMVLP